MSTCTQAGVAASCEHVTTFWAHRSRPASPGCRGLQWAVLILLRCRHRRLLRHRFEMAVARTGVSETSTFLVTSVPSARRAVIIEPFRLATTNGVGSNGVDSLPVFCRRTKTTSPSFKIVFFARVRLSARDFIFRFAAASFSRTTLSSTDTCCLTSGSFVCGSRANISR